MHFTLWKFQCIALELEILWKRWLLEPFASSLSLLCHFYRNLNTQTSWPHRLAVSCRQSLSCELIDKSQSDLNSSRGNYFPLCSLWPISIAQLFLRSFCLDFLCANLATPIISYHLFLESSLRPSYDPSCAIPGRFQSSDHLQGLLLEFSCANPATSNTSKLRNFSRPAHALPLKTPSAYSPDQFQSPDYFSTTSHWVLVCGSAQASPSGPFLLILHSTPPSAGTRCDGSAWTRPRQESQRRHFRDLPTTAQLAVTSDWGWVGKLKLWWNLFFSKMPLKIINDSSFTNLLANIGFTLQVLRFSLF